MKEPCSSPLFFLYNLVNLSQKAGEKRRFVRYFVTAIKKGNLTAKATPLKGTRRFQTLFLVLSVHPIFVLKELIQ